MNKKQSDKFKQAARELGCDEDEDAFNRALKQMKQPPETVDKATDKPGR